MRRTLTALLALALLIVFTGCTTTPLASSTTAPAAAETKQVTTEPTATPEPSLINFEGMFPVVNEPYELEYCIRYMPSVMGDWEKLWFWNWMQQKTNVTIKPRLIAEEVFDQQKVIMITSGDLPDVFFVQGWSTAEMYEYGLQEGVFIPITKYVDDNTLMPNLNLAFGMYPKAKPTSTLPDGNMYGLPIMMSDYYVTASGIRAQWVNEWLVAAGINFKDIKTLEDFRNALKACKAIDHNKNGKDDETPWSIYWGTDGKLGMAEVMGYVLNAYGIITGDGLVAIDYNTDKAVYTPLLQEYYDSLVYLNTLYTEKLLDNDLFAQTETDMAAKFANGLACFGTYWNPGITAPAKSWEEHTAKNFNDETLPFQPPLVDKAGDKAMTYASGKVTPNVFVVTKACEKPEVAMRWADACYDPVVATYYRVGPEYKSADDTFGVGWVYDPKITNGDSWAQALKDLGEDYTGWQYIQFHIASAASVGYFGMDECLGMFKLHPDYLSAQAPAWTDPYSRSIQPHEATGYPIVYYSEEENKIIENYQSALDEYVIQMTAKFIAGEEPLNADTWAAFQAQLKGLNVDDYNNVLSKAYETYKSNQ